MLAMNGVKGPRSLCAALYRIVFCKKGHDFSYPLALFQRKHNCTHVQHTEESGTALNHVIDTVGSAR
jgi:hypothetical protein